jgi:hypothetical protein
MGKAADWLREERRKVLGDWVAFSGTGEPMVPPCAPSFDRFEHQRRGATGQSPAAPDGWLHGTERDHG